MYCDVSTVTFCLYQLYAKRIFQFFFIFYVIYSALCSTLLDYRTCFHVALEYFGSSLIKVKVSTLDIAPLRETPPQKRSGTDHTVLPANFTVPASTS